MTTDWKALCVELTQQLDHALDFTVSSETRRYMKALVARARTELAQPEPEGPMPLPADGEVAELVAWLREEAESAEHDDAPIAAAKLTRTADLLERLAAQQVAIPGKQYHDDMGPVTWWRLPVDEPPWVGTPNDSDWPGHHTHFTPAPPEPHGQPNSASPSLRATSSIVSELVALLEQCPVTSDTDWIAKRSELLFRLRSLLRGHHMPPFSLAGQAEHG